MDLSLKSLQEAVSLRQQIQTLERRLASIFGTGRSAGRTSSGRGRRRSMSAATRAKLSAAARARWAQQRARGGKTLAKRPRKRGGLTAEGRRKLSEAMKARWAARRRAAQGRR